MLFWCVFTIFMFFATLKHAPITLKIVFASLSLTFLVLAICVYAESSVVRKIGGGIGLFCGGTAFYCGVAQVINGEFGTTMLPI